MKVLLREDVKNKGTAGTIIDVKPGFARNFLIPRGLAYIASDANMKVYEHEKYQKVKEREKMKSESEKVKTDIEKISLTAVVKVGDDEKLYGSVSSLTIADLLKEKGYTIHHRNILLGEPIRELGVFEVGIDLGFGVEAKIKVWVVKE